MTPFHPGDPLGQSSINKTPSLPPSLSFTLSGFTVSPSLPPSRLPPPPWDISMVCRTKVPRVHTTSFLFITNVTHDICYLLKDDSAKVHASGIK